MSYKAEISRDNPSCFLFLVDQSKSMQDKLSNGDETQQMANGVADSINRWLQELSIKCAKSEGVRDYYNVGVIGYGRTVGPSFVGFRPRQDRSRVVLRRRSHAAAARATRS